jgi:hypothetical protein
MSDALAKRIGELTAMGWTLKSHTDTTAALDMRKPFNWWLFLLFVILLFGFGALLYLMFYLLMPKSQVFLVDKDGTVTATGDLWYIEKQEQQREMWIQKQKDIQEKGFLKVMWPAIIAVIFMVALWFFWIWLFTTIAYD